jgi:hypothetical protein
MAILILVFHLNFGESEFAITGPTDLRWLGPVDSILFLKNTEEPILKVKIV